MARDDARRARRGRRAGVRDQGAEHGARRPRLYRALDQRRLLLHAPGFERLVEFLQDPATRELRRRLLQGDRSARRELAASYASLDDGRVEGFLCTLNREVVQAKAMFLAYEDPFEKFRALLFECLFVSLSTTRIRRLSARVGTRTRSGTASRRS